MICVQVGRRILCLNRPGHHVHALSNAHAGCPSAAHICDHYDARSKSRCDEPVYIWTMRANVHLCVSITADQHRWLNAHRPTPEDALRYLGYIGWAHVANTTCTRSIA